MAFFNTVYNAGIKDDSWYGMAEAAANVLRAPRRWLIADLGLNFKIYTVNIHGVIDSIRTNACQGIKKIIRVIVSLVLVIPGEFLAASFMAAAYLSPEIRLKHTATVRKLTDLESSELTKMIQERQRLEKERQGEPVTCWLATVICLSCTVLCCKS